MGIICIYDNKISINVVFFIIIAKGSKNINTFLINRINYFIGFLYIYYIN